MIEITKLSHAFDEKSIFRDAKLSISEGEVIWLQGENGSGKTTLFRILSGILEPVSDEEPIINLKGEVVKIAEMRHEVNYIPSKPYLFEYLSGRDNMEYLISLFDLEGSYNQIIKNIVALRLEDDLDLEVHTYSLGMKAKLYLAIMIERVTSLIIIDELLNNIDVESLKAVVKIFENKTTKGGSSIIFSSHTQIVEVISNTKVIHIRNKRLE